MINNNDNINLHYLFVYTLVHNKHLLFNMHGMNIKVICNNFCFSTATMFARTRFNVMLYVHCLSFILMLVMYDLFIWIYERLEATTYSATCSNFTEKQFQIYNENNHVFSYTVMTNLLDT